MIEVSFWNVMFLRIPEDERGLRAQKSQETTQNMLTVSIIHLQMFVAWHIIMFGLNGASLCLPSGLKSIKLRATWRSKCMEVNLALMRR
jgi:hypothetical protein